VQWKKYKTGHLVSSNQGYYFIERRFDYALGDHRWFVQYDPLLQVGKFRKARQIGTTDGYLTLKAAKAYCEDAARSLSDLRETDET
jgi:hypothetical protein